MLSVWIALCFSEGVHLWSKCLVLACLKLAEKEVKWKLADHNNIGCMHKTDFLTKGRLILDPGWEFTYHFLFWSMNIESKFDDYAVYILETFFVLNTGGKT